MSTTVGAKVLNLVSLFAVISMFGLAVLVIRGVWRFDEKQRAESEKYHEVVLATTVDASAGTGLARISQVMVRTPDGACTITVHRYERNSTNDLFLRQPIIETLPCSGT